jgi:Ca2+-binding RTX toxin-like protein
LPQTGERTARRKEERGDYRNEELVEEDDYEVGGIDVDKLFGGLDDDDLWGGRGPDTAHGGNGEDLAYGQEGADTLKGGDQNDRLHGRDEIVNNDFVIGGGGTDDECYADSPGEIDYTTCEHVFLP